MFVISCAAWHFFRRMKSGQFSPSLFEIHYIESIPSSFNTRIPRFAHRLRSALFNSSLSEWSIVTCWTRFDADFVQRVSRLRRVWVAMSWNLETVVVLALEEQSPSPWFLLQRSVPHWDFHPRQITLLHWRSRRILQWNWKIEEKRFERVSIKISGNTTKPTLNDPANMVLPIMWMKILWR